MCVCVCVGGWVGVWVSIGFAERVGTLLHVLELYYLYWNFTTLLLYYFTIAKSHAIKVTRCNTVRAS